MRWNSYERFSEAIQKIRVAQTKRTVFSSCTAAAFVLMFIVRLET